MYDIPDILLILRDRGHKSTGIKSSLFGENGGMRLQITKSIFEGAFSNCHWVSDSNTINLCWMPFVQDHKFRQESIPAKILKTTNKTNKQKR